MSTVTRFRLPPARPRFQRLLLSAMGCLAASWRHCRTARAVPLLALSVMGCLAAFCGPALELRPAAAEQPTLESVVERLESGRETRIVCFGDSITGVYYHSGGERAWCDMLGLALRKGYPDAEVRMINAGVSGHTTVNGLSRIERDVIEQKPHLVVVMFGMNDVTRVPRDVFRDNLKSIVRRCLDANAAVLLCTPNSVYENAARPNARLAEYSEDIRRVAAEFELPLVDCFEVWKQQRAEDETAWMLWMSDAIHPNLNGHKRFAELIAAEISGKRVSLDEVAPARGALRHTFELLAKQNPVNLVAMPPYDQRIPEALRKHFPGAEFQVTVWPAEGRAVEELAEWGKRIRGLNPDLVVPAVPVGAPADDTGSFIRGYEWVLNWSFPFAGRGWDVVPVFRRSGEAVSATVRARRELVPRILAGKDVVWFDEREALDDWVEQQRQRWLDLRE